jgi:ABC-type tungstate transport system substrate-binding protein
MTATIALETSKGNVSLGIVLGTILISLTLLISISLNFLNKNNDQSK